MPPLKTHKKASSVKAQTKTQVNSKTLPQNRLLSFIEKWAFYFSSTPKQEQSTLGQKPPKAKFRLSTSLLRLLPFLCCAGFLLSLIWDLSGQFNLPWRKESIALDGLLGKVCVTGLVGFLTNWLAIKMLFYPRKARPLLGQGLIPARKDRIVLRLGEQISGEIINSQLILERITNSGLLSKHRQKLAQGLRKALKQPEFRKDLFSLVQYYIDQILRSPEVQKSLRDFIDQINVEELGILESGLFKFYKFLSGEQGFNRKIEYLLNKLQMHPERCEKYLNENLDKLPEILEEDKQAQALEKNILQVIVFLVEQINIQDVIMDNLKAFDEIRLEKLLWRSSSDQLIYIQYLGCFLGILGGFFLWLPLEAILSAFVLGSAVWSLDVLLLNLRNSEQK